MLRKALRKIWMAQYSIVRKGVVEVRGCSLLLSASRLKPALPLLCRFIERNSDREHPMKALREQLISSDVLPNG